MPNPQSFGVSFVKPLVELHASTATMVSSICAYISLSVPS